MHDARSCADAGQPYPFLNLHECVCTVYAVLLVAGRRYLNFGINALQSRLRIRSDIG
jgi:hypothetical protein